MAESDLLQAGDKKRGGRSPRTKALKRTAPDYAELFFDHLYSEYLTLKPSIKNSDTIDLLENLRGKRENSTLTWSDIYAFDLALVQVRPLENLLRKAYDARAKYRSIAGQKEYDEYVASKPPNLPEIRFDPKANPPQPEVFTERALRADLEYLLSKFYLYYAMLPVREGKRDWLTNIAVIITVGAVVVLGLGIFFNLSVALGVFPSLAQLNAATVPFVTVLTVALAGIVGGCVSMLQRIQSAPSEGDALYNLAALTSGWKGIFLSPLYGGIFAALLFVLFAAGLLEGSAFPKINTPRRQWGPQAIAAQTTAPSPPPSGSPALSPTRTVVAPLTAALPAASTPTPSPTPSPAASASPTPTPTPAPSPGPTPGTTQTSGVLQRTAVMEIKDFLTYTGPADGVSYALLIIWSFIAGFAERLVPDTLNRLVTKNEKIQGTDT